MTPGRSSLDQPALGAVVLALAALLIGAGVALALSWRRIQARMASLPPDATLFETVRALPFLAVIGLDLLDMSLDVFAAPLSWVILDRLGLRALRGAATLEALVPGTQFIPVWTIAWALARLVPGR